MIIAALPRAISVFFIFAQGLCLSATEIGALLPPPEDSQDIIYLSAQGPIFIRLRMRIDDLTLKQAAAEFASSLFATLDEDENGLITLEQAASTPGVGRTIKKHEMVAWDTEPIDEKLSLLEFTTFLQNELGKLFFMRAVQSGGTQSINLFEHLDINKDYRLSKQEIGKSSKTLAIHDYDEDDTISSIELLPFRNPLAPRITSMPDTSAADMPFVTLKDSSLDTAVQVLLSRYGTATMVPPTTIHLAERLVIDTTRIEPFDIDGNNQLDVAELTTLCKNLPPDIELSIQLPRLQRGRPIIKVDSRLHSSSIEVERISSSRVSLSIHNTKFELRAVGTRTQAFDNRSFYKLKFRTADRNKNGYLEPEEFPGLELADADFATADRNTDGKLFREELLMFLDADTMAAQSRIVMSVLANNQSLFKILDLNYDLRLSARELANATNRIAPLDKNLDDLLSKAELDQKYRITFSMGEPPLFRQSMSNAQPTIPTPRTAGNTSGPNWFRHMDRNQDGDLSWREFLGSQPEFAMLDTNQDGLISAKEAAK